MASTSAVTTTATMGVIEIEQAPKGWSFSSAGQELARGSRSLFHDSFFLGEAGLPLERTVEDQWPPEGLKTEHQRLSPMLRLVVLGAVLAACLAFGSAQMPSCESNVQITGLCASQPEVVELTTGTDGRSWPGGRW
jgi:hypothetical protein